MDPITLYKIQAMFNITALSVVSQQLNFKKITWEFMNGN